MQRIPMTALALAALLTACGGGDTTSLPSATPQQVSADLRPKALAVAAAAVDPGEAARQLFDFAESHLEYGLLYFPRGPSTQSAPPFLYRYYPSTQIYLGVASGGDATYPDGVYAMGGEFGSAPVFVGPITRFITPVEPGTGPTGANNGCENLAIYDAEGATSIVTYQASGAETGTLTTDTQIKGLSTFDGTQWREVSSKTTGTLSSSEGSLPVEVEGKSYVRRTGSAELTHHSDVAKVSTAVDQFRMTTTNTTVWSPPYVDKRYGLSVGGSYSYAQTGTSTSVVDLGIPNFPPTTTTSPVSRTTTVKYIGRESVQVPANPNGYSTCKFETTDASTAEVTTTWVIINRGVAAKSVTVRGTSTTTMEATSITINGQQI